MERRSNSSGGGGGGSERRSKREARNGVTSRSGSGSRSGAARGTRVDAAPGGGGGGGRVSSSLVIDVDQALEQRAADSALEAERTDEAVKSLRVAPCEWLLTVLAVLLCIVTVPVSLLFCVKVVYEYERAVIFRLGRLLSVRANGPGLFFILPCLDTYQKVDLRMRTLEVPLHEVITSDSLSVRVSVACHYRVERASIWAVSVAQPLEALGLVLQAKVRALVAKKDLSYILQHRPELAQHTKECLDAVVGSWGIKVERAEINDVRIPLELQTSVCVEADANRAARARLIAAQAEKQTALELSGAARVLAAVPGALSLRYLHTLDALWGARGGSHLGLTLALPRLELPAMADEQTGATATAHSSSEAARQEGAEAGKTNAGGTQDSPML
ncbi:stomatin-like [Petromyzon marinus]|uniref:Podocin n=1 Tax=Petromyzon marinus TaxID=7757 RepID=A0AAJ7TJZ6_PETMA|nr:erythrocyte band 7 integral membrane protein-like [Petromyzon marinus]